MRRKSPDMEFVEDRFCIRGFRVYIILPVKLLRQILMRASSQAGRNGQTGNVPENRCVAGYCRRSLTGRMM